MLLKCHSVNLYGTIFIENHWLWVGLIGSKLSMWSILDTAVNMIVFKAFQLVSNCLGENFSCTSLWIALLIIWDYSLLHLGFKTLHWRIKFLRIRWMRSRKSKGSVIEEPNVLNRFISEKTAVNERVRKSTINFQISLSNCNVVKGNRCLL